MASGDNHALVTAFILLTALPTCADAQPIGPVSGARTVSATGSGGSFLPVFSHDGHFIAFLSHANNLVTNDDAGRTLDVFVSDMTSGITELVSVNASGFGGGNADSTHLSLSRYALGVAFTSRSSNLTTNDTNNVTDVFLRDRTSGAFRRTTLASADRFGRSPAEPVPYTVRPLSSNPRIEAFGPRVVFQSVATNLTSLADTNNANDVFFTGAAAPLVLVSVAHHRGAAADGASHSPQVSDNGQYVAFISTATNLVLNGDTNRGGDIYVRDLSFGGNYWLSANTRPLLIVNPPLPAPPSTYKCFNFALSASGRSVVYQATAGGPSSSNVLLYFEIGFTNPVLIASDSDLVGRPQISSQGDWVAFSSRSNVYLWSRATGSNILVSANTNSVPGNGPSHSPVMDRFANYVAFLSRASDLVPDGASNHFQVYVYDCAARITRLVSVNTNGAPSADNFELSNLAIAPEGPLLVAFDSTASDLIANDFNGQSDVFVRDVSRNETLLISRAHASRPARTSTLMSGSNASVSGDGRIVAFTSFDSPFVPDDTNIWQDVFVRDLMSGDLQRISGQQVYEYFTAQAAVDPVVSRAGNRVAYSVVRSGSGGPDRVLFLSDLLERTNVLVIRDSSFSWLGSTSLSSNGNLVIFQSPASVQTLVSNRTDRNTGDDIFVRDMSTGEIRLVSVDYTGTRSGDGPSSNAVLSPNGQWVVFESRATNLRGCDDGIGVSGCLDSPGGLYLRDLQSDDTNYLVSPNVIGRSVFSGDSSWMAFVRTNLEIHVRSLVSHGRQQVCSACDLPALNQNGRFVVYVDRSSQGPRQIHLKDMQTGLDRLVSATSSGVGGNGHSTNPLITADGRFIVFESLASDLVANDNNNAADIFVADRFLRTVLLLTINTFGTGSANGPSSKPVLSADGRKLVFQSLASDLITGDYNDRRDVFIATLSMPDSDGDGMDDDYEITYFDDLSRDGAGDYDADGQTDYEEFIAGTNPRDDASILRVISISASDATVRQLIWSSVAGRHYAVQYKDSLGDSWSNLAGVVTANSTTATKTDSAAALHRFYRVVVAE
jgi:Tol biopolymer transport system component